MSTIGLQDQRDHKPSNHIYLLNASKKRAKVLVFPNKSGVFPNKLRSSLGGRIFWEHPTPRAFPNINHWKKSYKKKLKNFPYYIPSWEWVSWEFFFFMQNALPALMS